MVTPLTDDQSLVFHFDCLHKSNVCITLVCCLCHIEVRRVCHGFHSVNLVQDRGLADDLLEGHLDFDHFLRRVSRVDHKQIVVADHKEPVINR